MRLELHCLHGTFQTPAAWSGFEGLLRDRLPEYGPPVVLADDVLRPVAAGAEDWARSYCGGLPLRAAARVLVGYSLGGRLGLHALLACPAAWKAAVIVSAHPGGGSAEERETVRGRDADWAARCRGDDPVRLLADWDRQAVFAGVANPLPRPADGFRREDWARAFERFSRARQEDLRPSLRAADLPPLLYVSGSLDERYRAHGDDLAACLPNLVHVTVENAAHRVPWEQPSAFAMAVADFLRDRLPPVSRS